MFTHVKFLDIVFNPGEQRRQLIKPQTHFCEMATISKIIDTRYIIYVLYYTYKCFEIILKIKDIFITNNQKS